MAFFTRRQPPQPDGRYEALEAEYRNYRRRTALELEDAAGKSARQTVLPERATTSPAWTVCPGRTRSWEQWA